MSFTRMSLRNAIRTKLRSNDRSSEAGHTNSLSNPAVKSANVGENSSAANANEDMSSEDWHKFEDKEVFEMQLSNLQEQLVSTMITNQKLTKEINQLKEEKYVVQLYKQLEDQKDKNDELQARVTQLEEEAAMNESMQCSDEADSPMQGNLIHTTEEEIESSTSAGPLGRLHTWFQVKIMTILQDFSDDSDLDDSPEPVEEELSVRKLKENMRRFKSGTEPPLLYFKVLSALFSWKSPASTFLAFMLYMYSIYSGWFLTVFFGLILWHFSKTYFISRGWNIQFSLLPYHTIEEVVEEDKTLGMTDKFQLVLQVAKKAQNFLGEAADGLEKINNLMTWSDVEVTKTLYKNVLGGFFLSLFLPASTILTYIGFFIGIKLFITANLYQRYPRLKQKYDTTRIMWKKLPTNEQKLQQQIIAQRRQYLVQGRRLTSSLASQPLEAVSECDSNKAFNDVFKLPNNEIPLPGWEDGKRSTLIQKEKAIAAAFRSGKLYLTKNYLCFRRSRIFSQKNIIIPLCDITQLEKKKPFNFMPGSGMSIEIQVSSVEKPFVFGAIINRDEVFNEVLQVAKASQLAWSKDTGSEEEHAPNVDEVDVST